MLKPSNRLVQGSPMFDPLPIAAILVIALAILLDEFLRFRQWLRTFRQAQAAYVQRLARVSVQQASGRLSTDRFRAEQPD
jgi:hypothetical protein